MLQTDPPAPEPEAAEESVPPVEYIHIAIDLIETEAQVRTGIDPAGEAIFALAESIRERGIIQPLTVCRNGNGYFLTVGNRPGASCLGRKCRRCESVIAGL